MGNHRLHRYFLAAIFLCMAGFSYAQPEAISDLTALAGSGQGEGTVTLQWTAPDPCDASAAPSGYLIKWATAQVSSADFYSTWVNTYTYTFDTFQSSGTQESAVLTGLTPGATLYFAVAAIDSGSAYGLWTSSLEVSGVNSLNYGVIFGNIPGEVAWNTTEMVVSSVTVAVSSTTLRWTWLPVSNVSEPWAGYRVISSTSGTILGSLPADTTVYFLQGLAPNTSAEAYIEAYNGLLTSTSSSKVFFTQAQYIPLSVVSSTNTKTKIDLFWQALDNPAYTRYSVQRSLFSDFTSSITVMGLAAATTHQDTGLAEGSTYYYRIWPANYQGLAQEYVQYSTCTVRIAPCSPPSFSVTGRATEGYDGYVDLSWSTSGDDGQTGRCSFYMIRWSTSPIATDADFDLATSSYSVGATQDFGNSQTATITGLFPGTTYWFAIKAVDAALAYSYDVNLSSSLPTYNVKRVVSPDYAPPCPFNVTATALSSSTVNVSWDHPVMPGYDDRDLYRVYRAETLFTSTASATDVFSPLVPLSTYYVDTGLEAKTTYYYVVTSFDLGDQANGLFSLVFESSHTAAVFVRTPDQEAPAPISQIFASTGTFEGEIALTWESPGDDGMAGNISNGWFGIEYSTDEAYPFNKDDRQISISTSTSPGSTNFAMITGRTGGATYYIRIWTADTDGNWSEISAGATAWAQVDVTPPSVITQLSPAAFWRGVTLSWSSPGDNGTLDTLNGAYELRAHTEVLIDTTTWEAVPEGYPYRVSWSTSVAPGIAESQSITGLTNNVTYYFSLRAVDDTGNWSVVSATAMCAVPLNHAPASFTLSSPADGWISTDTARPIFAWNAPEDSDTQHGDTLSYSVVYSTDSSFSVAVATAYTASTSCQALSDLPEDQIVYWYVIAKDSDAASVQASTQAVWINAVNDAPAAFDLFDPPDGSTTTTTPTLQWDASSDLDPGNTVTYRIEYSIHDNFVPSTQVSGITTNYYTVPTLTFIENTTYWWRVYATDGSSVTLCGSPFSFLVNAVEEEPYAFNISSPLNNSRQMTTTVEFTWEKTSDPDPGQSITYDLVYSNYFDFSDSVTVSGLLETTTSVQLIDNRAYYWKVEAVDSSEGHLTRPSGQTYKLYVDLVNELPQAFDLADPYDVTISTTLAPWFVWQPAVDPDPEDTVRYYIEISDNPGFTGSQPIPTGMDTFYQPLADLLDQTTYYWRVRASGYLGSPPKQTDTGFTFSPVKSFVISMTNNPPQAFGLAAPASGSMVSTKTPKLEWQASVDTDINDTVMYTLSISTTADMSVLWISSDSLRVTSFVVQQPLREDTMYYWNVTSRDKKGSATSSASTFSFFVPVISTPLAPVGLRGNLAEDQLSFAVSWSSVTKNSDGTVIDDLAGYAIYRTLSLVAIAASSRLAFVSLDQSAWTDTTLNGGRFYYFVRAVDNSGIESANSLILESLQPDTLTLMSSDLEVVAAVPPEVSRLLLAENNAQKKDLTMSLRRRTDLEINSRLRVYDLAVEDALFNEITPYEFSAPITLQFPYSTVSQAEGRGAPYVSSYTSGDIGVYWHNGVEFIRVASYMDESKKKVVIQVQKPGQYQLRRVARATSFGLASLNPAKVFTPGIAPYPKMEFNIDNPAGDKVTGKIFDLRGEFVADLSAQGDATAKTVTLEWDGRGTRKGVYIYQIECEGRVINGTVVVAR